MTVVALQLNQRYADDKFRNSKVVASRSSCSAPPGRECTSSPVRARAPSHYGTT